MSEPRVVESDIRAIIDTDPAIDLYPHILNANILTNKVSRVATEKSITVTDDELKVIEKYVAAHFYSLVDPQYIEKETGRARGKFPERDWYGIAKMLDPTGVLDSEEVTPNITWLGTVID